MNNKIKNSLTSRILNRLKSGEVKMRPKGYFILRAVLVALITCLVALFVLYLVSFIFFSLRASGVWFLPGFGFGAMGVFIKSLPWSLILIALILIVVLELFVKRFGFAYRRPILYSVLVIVVFTLLGSLLIAKTPLHSDIFLRAHQGKLPPLAGGFYRGFGMPKLPDVHFGVVCDIGDNEFCLETDEGETLVILVASTTAFSLGADITEDDRVVVLGKRDDSRVEASAVRRIEEEFGDFRRGLPHPMPPMPWYK